MLCDFEEERNYAVVGFPWKPTERERTRYFAHLILKKNQYATNCVKKETHRKQQQQQQHHQQQKQHWIFIYDTYAKELITRQFHVLKKKYIQTIFSCFGIDWLLTVSVVYYVMHPKFFGWLKIWEVDNCWLVGEYIVHHISFNSYTIRIFLL